MIKYFDHDKLKVLIDYITVMPLEDVHNRGHKFPFLAGEIFNCEINQLLDRFFEAPVKPLPVEAQKYDVESKNSDDSIEGATNLEEEAKKEEATKSNDDDTVEPEAEVTTENKENANTVEETKEVTPKSEDNETTPVVEEEAKKAEAAVTEEKKEEQKNP